MRVLYVDDDPIMTKAVERMLASEGFDCDTADLGNTAVELAKDNEYDIILLDVMLPDIDGYEVIERLRSAGLRTPVLLQSGLVDRENDFEGLWLGASQYLLKPFDKTELVERIRAVLSRATDDGASESRHLSDPSAPAEQADGRRRRHRRFETVQPGTILSNGGIDCLIMDMSYGGAALQLSDPEADVPETFDLRLQSGSTLRCSVRWRSGGKVGVQGEALFPDEIMADMLKQGDVAPAAAPEPHRSDPPTPGPDRSEAAAEAPVPSTPMPEPQPERQTRRPPHDEAPAELRPTVPAHPGPEGPTPSGQPVATAEAALQQSSAPHPVTGGACAPGRSESDSLAARQPAEFPGQPPQQPPVAASESPAPNGHGLEPDLESEDGTGDDGQLFTVDRGTRLVAEACDCEELVIDGHLEASARAQRLRLGPEGRFVGRAEVEVAEIRGHCEGNLIVTGSLVIFAGATVSGTTRYRQIVIEAGGGLLGLVQLLPKGPAEAARAEGEPRPPCR
jgi:DNA-binding response OmpR family regulator/cytoskeletal protein CcmA (bactofilin family)